MTPRLHDRLWLPNAEFRKKFDDIRHGQFVAGIDSLWLVFLH